MFVAAEQEAIRDTLSTCTAYVLSQKLIPHRTSPDRVLAMEVLNVRDSYAIRNNILDGDFYKIPGNMETGQKQTKMITMDQHLEQLCRTGRISYDAALEKARQPIELRRRLGDLKG